MADVAGIVRNAVPSIDETVVDYIVGFVKSAPQDADDDEDIASVVGPMLEDAGGDEAAIQNVLQQLQSLVLKESTNNVPKPHANGLAKLDKVVDMRREAALSKTAFIARQGTDLDSVSGRKVQSHVDTKKLAKAEAKIKAKWEKRVRNAEYETSKLIEPQEKSYEEFYLEVNPLDLSASKGKSKDIVVENFDISFAGLRILTNADLRISFGRRYGLCGRNGQGKSTLLRAISRREIAIPTHITILHVDQEIVGDETTALESVLAADVWRSTLLKQEKEINTRLNELEKEQDATAEIKAEKEDLSSRLGEVHAKLTEIEADKAESRAATILSGLGFPQEKQSFATKQFSGGWRMRLALARALFCKPDLLLLDEVTNHLDLNAVAWLEDYLQKWPNSLICVSHDRAFLNRVATDIIHQHSERLDHYKGNFAQFYATREERRKNQLKEYKAQMEYRAHLQAFIDRWRYNANRGPQAQSKIKVLEKLPVLEPPEDDAVVTFKFPEVEAISPPLLKMDDVNFGYTKDNILLKHVDINVDLESRIGVVGPNGAGKSTLLKLLTKQLEPTSGFVERHGRLRIAYFTQHHVDQLDVQSDISAAGYLAQKFHGKTEEEYRRHLGSFGISGTTALQPIRTLSGGQKSRVAFSMLCLQNPHILVLDEPTNHLDIESLDALAVACAKFAGGIICVSHDETFLTSTCKELWVCDHGTMTPFKGGRLYDLVYEFILMLRRLSLQGSHRAKRSSIGYLFVHYSYLIASCNGKCCAAHHFRLVRMPRRTCTRPRETAPEMPTDMDTTIDESASVNASLNKSTSDSGNSSAEIQMHMTTPMTVVCRRIEDVLSEVTRMRSNIDSMLVVVNVTKEQVAELKHKIDALDLWRTQTDSSRRDTILDTLYI